MHASIRAQSVCHGKRVTVGCRTKTRSQALRVLSERDHVSDVDANATKFAFPSADATRVCSHSLPVLRVNTHHADTICQSTRLCDLRNRRHELLITSGTAPDALFVCKSWSASSAYHLFREIWVNLMIIAQPKDTDGPYCPLCWLLKLSPRVAHNVRSLRWNRAQPAMPSPSKPSLSNSLATSSLSCLACILSISIYPEITSH